MFGDYRAVVPVGLMIGMVVAVALAIFITDRFADGVLLVLALGLLVASYAARQRARDRFLYRNRDG